MKDVVLGADSLVLMTTFKNTIAGLAFNIIYDLNHSSVFKDIIRIALSKYDTALIFNAGLHTEFKSYYSNLGEALVYVYLILFFLSLPAVKLLGI